MHLFILEYVNLYCVTHAQRGVCFLHCPRPFAPQSGGREGQGRQCFWSNRTVNLQSYVSTNCFFQGVWEGVMLGHLYSYGPKNRLSHMHSMQVCVLYPPQSIMLRWQPPPLTGQNGEITSYKIRYRKGSRRSETSETIGGTQLFKLIGGNGCRLSS